MTIVCHLCKNSQVIYARFDNGKIVLKGYCKIIMIWIIGILIFLGVCYIYSKVVDPSQALYKKLIRHENENIDRWGEEKAPGDDEKLKVHYQKIIKELKSDQELYLRLLERYSGKKELKRIKNDYYTLLHSKDEINTIIGIDPTRMEDQLQRYQIKVEEIGKRFRAYGLENSEA